MLFSLRSRTFNYGDYNSSDIEARSTGSNRQRAFAFQGTVRRRALTGEGDLSEARRWFGHTLERAGWSRQDRVHDESAESFPASDAPSFTPTVGTGLSGHARTR